MRSWLCFSGALVSFLCFVGPFPFIHFLTSCLYASFLKLMKLSLIALLLLCSAFSALSLSLGEQEALLAFYRTYPLLGSQPQPWTSNVTQACVAPGFTGVTCSNEEDPHVIGLYDDLFFPNDPFHFPHPFSRHNVIAYVSNLTFNPPMAIAIANSMAHW